MKAKAKGPTSAKKKPLKLQDLQTKRSPRGGRNSGANTQLQKPANARL